LGMPLVVFASGTRQVLCCSSHERNISHLVKKYCAITEWPQLCYAITKVL
jgi:hypothetical protein